MDLKAMPSKLCCYLLGMQKAGALTFKFERFRKFLNPCSFHGLFMCLTLVSNVYYALLFYVFCSL